MSKFYKRTVSLLVLALFGWFSVRYFELSLIWSGFIKLLQQPAWLTGILAVYFLSFCLKAKAWQLYLLGRGRFSTCLYGVLYSLLINHLLPIKAGDVIRAKLMSTRDSVIADDEAFHSVIVLRMLDLLCLGGMTALGLFLLDISFVLPENVIAAGLVAAAGIFVLLMRRFPVFFRRHIHLLQAAMRGKRGAAIFVMTLLSWILEAAIVYGTIAVLYGGLTPAEAMFANSFTVAGQVFQITPGGIGNYESFLLGALHLFEFSPSEAYTAALLTHGLKFGFSYGAGFAVWLRYPLSIYTIKNWIFLKGVSQK